MIWCGICDPLEIAGFVKDRVARIIIRVRNACFVIAVRRQWIWRRIGVWNCRQTIEFIVINLRFRRQNQIAGHRDNTPKEQGTLALNINRSVQARNDALLVDIVIACTGLSSDIHRNHILRT